MQREIELALASIEELREMRAIYTRYLRAAQSNRDTAVIVWFTERIQAIDAEIETKWQEDNSTY
jgi:hypothetical protein